MKGSKTLFCSSEFLSARERICSKFIYSLGTRPQKDSTALGYAISDESFRA